MMIAVVVVLVYTFAACCCCLVGIATNRGDWMMVIVVAITNAIMLVWKLAVAVKSQSLSLVSLETQLEEVMRKILEVVSLLNISQIKRSAYDSGEKVYDDDERCAFVWLRVRRVWFNRLEFLCDMYTPSSSAAT
jgi:hypothetical protein